MKLPLSVCIVTHNEEHNIGECLQSVQWAEQIIVVDDFSDDHTAEICKKYGARVILNKWQGHVEQKSFCLEQATLPWALCIDADERVSEKLHREIERAMADQSSCVGYYLPRKTHYLGRWITRGGWYPNYQLRFFKRDKGKWGGDNPHDRIILDGVPGYLKGDLYHYTYRDITHHIQAVNSFTTISARVKYEKNKGHIFFHLLFNPPGKFFKMYILKRGFLDGWAGFIVAIIGSFYVFLKYAKLWEMKKREMVDKSE